MSKSISNVHPFPKRGPEQQRRADRQEIGLGSQGPTSLRGAELWRTEKPAAPTEALEKALDEHRTTLLELAHKKQQFALQMRIEENTAQIKLEAMAYRALIAGVPESDIYALGEDMAVALSSAMNTVAGA